MHKKTHTHTELLYEHAPQIPNRNDLMTMESITTEFEDMEITFIFVPVHAGVKGDE